MGQMNDSRLSPWTPLSSPSPITTGPNTHGTSSGQSGMQAAHSAHDRQSKAGARCSSRCWTSYSRHCLQRSPGLARADARLDMQGILPHPAPGLMLNMAPVPNHLEWTLYAVCVLAWPQHALEAACIMDCPEQVPRVGHHPEPTRVGAAVAGSSMQSEGGRGSQAGPAQMLLQHRSWS